MENNLSFASLEEEHDYMWKNKTGPVDGIYLPLAPPGSPPWEEKIAQLRQMTLRDDDVILFAYAKAGNHWLWEMITMLRKNTAQHDRQGKLHDMMEFVSIDQMDELPSPRTLNTHLPFCLFPVEELKARRLKFVHVYRNPKDVAVSAYYMVKSAPRSVAPYPIDSFSSFLHAFMFGNRPSMLGSYFGHLRQMHVFQRQNPELPFFNLAYEDVKKNPMKYIKELAQFLEVSVSEELCEEIATACSFDSMKKQEALKAFTQFSKDQHTRKLRQGRKEKPVIFRKGQIGDWKNHFTVADNERMDEMIKREMKGLPFTLTFE